MEFQILGQVRAVSDGRAIEFSGRQRALLALLLLNANRPVGGQRLIDELWEGGPPPTAATALQVHVSHLRSALEPHRGRDQGQ